MERQTKANVYSEGSRKNQTVWRRENSEGIKRNVWQEGRQLTKEKVIRLIKGRRVDIGKAGWWRGDS